ncbi:MAG: PIN domain-containing protein [Luteitalea sp.]|nr:PIN domain-containing protein [Luteitalea sp.]
MVSLCDSNVWLALTLSKHIHHRVVRNWFDTVQTSGSAFFCRATQQALLRLLTNASVLAPYGNAPLTNRKAWAAYEALLGDDRIALRTEEPPEVESRWKDLALRDTSSPKLWMDAYLAAFALTAGYRMVTTDASFRQFSGLDVLILSEPPRAADETRDDAAE